MQCQLLNLTSFYFNFIFKIYSLEYVDKIKYHKSNTSIPTYIIVRADRGTQFDHKSYLMNLTQSIIIYQMCLESNVLAVLAAQHRDNRGLSREEAELQYIREAVLLEAPLNAHLYRLRRSKNEAGPGRILLAICARGVRVYAEEETPRVFAWNNIGKLCFDVSFFFEILQ